MANTKVHAFNEILLLENIISGLSLPLFGPEVIAKISQVNVGCKI